MINKIYSGFKSKKALSAVISTVLIISLTIAIAAMIFGFVKTFVQEETQGTYECFETMDKVLINSQYTCYNSSSEIIKIAIQIKELNITKLLVSVSDNQNSKTFELTHTPQSIEHIQEEVKVPDTKSQKVYYFNYSSAGLNTPTSIRIAPFAGKRQCDVSDELKTINSC
ncbi:MAG: archaellin/type IV pilin N-terminal domain-containing protein [Nanoarchaeota archaeon]